MKKWTHQLEINGCESDVWFIVMFLARTATGWQPLRLVKWLVSSRIFSALYSFPLSKDKYTSNFLERKLQRWAFGRRRKVGSGFVCHPFVESEKTHLSFSYLLVWKNWLTFLESKKWFCLTLIIIHEYVGLFERQKTLAIVDEIFESLWEALRTLFQQKPPSLSIFSLVVQKQAPKCSRLAFKA